MVFGKRVEIDWSAIKGSIRQTRKQDTGCILGTTDGLTVATSKTITATVTGSSTTATISSNTKENGRKGNNLGENRQSSNSMKMTTQSTSIENQLNSFRDPI